MNCSEAVLRSLAENGVTACFANPGTSEMHLVAAFDRVGGIRPVLGLFEGVCTGAADGYARIAETPAATLLHLGPGLGNGFANLHNAWRARSRIVNLIGDHATWHRAHDAPLTSDIHAVARPVSHWIGDPADPADAVRLVREAIGIASRANGGLASLIVPADIAWSDAPDIPLARVTVPAPPALQPAAIRAAAEALTASEAACLFVGGRAGSERAMRLAAAIAAKTGAQVITDTFMSRLARGQGRPSANRLAYLGELAALTMQPFRTVVIAGTKAPVAFFAYPGKPSTFIAEGADVIAITEAESDVVAALEALAAELDAKPVAAPAKALPEMPADGPLTVEAFGKAFAALLPDNAIVSDESATAGLWAWIASDAARPHDWMMLMGGAIGQGIPLAVGAAVAAPDRPVIALQADGSAMYTLQGLWTAARENLDVIALILNNRAYAILQMELDRVGATAQSDRSRSLLSLDRPPLNFCLMAQGMGVPAQRVETVDALKHAFGRAQAARGPQLIEVMLA